VDQNKKQSGVKAGWTKKVKDWSVDNGG